MSKFFKNRYQNESCIIFGNGPSLLNFKPYFSSIKIQSFCTNGFCEIFKEISYRPNFVCMSNFDAISNYLDKYSAHTVKFIRRGYKDSGEFENLNELPFQCEHHKGLHGSSFIKDKKFSLDPFERNYCGDTVVLDFALPLAVYMGFRKIVFVGVDFNYSAGYFSSHYQRSEVPDFQGMVNGDYSISVDSFRFCYDYLKGRDIDLFQVEKNDKLNFIPLIESTQLMNMIQNHIF